MTMTRTKLGGKREEKKQAALAEAKELRFQVPFVQKLASSLLARNLEP